MINNEDDFLYFPFKYYPFNFGDECAKIPTSAELQIHVNKTEIDKKAYIENILKEKSKFAKIHNYDIIICDRWTFENSDEIDTYQLICRSLIFNDSDMDEQFLLCALRLLYICPMCFHHLQGNELQMITEKLVDLAINKEEPLCTHAIKCLQVVAYFSLQNGKVVQNFNKLAMAVIDRLLVSIDEPGEDSLDPLQTLRNKKIRNFDESLDIVELYESFNESQFKESPPKFNICSYIDVGEISNSSSKKFHRMALLNYIYPHIDIDEIVENTNLIELIHTCITRTGSEFLVFRCFALSIICSFSNNDKFMIKFVEKKCFERIFAIPYNFSSNIPLFIFFKQMQTNFRLLDIAIANDASLVDWILRYAIKMYSVTDNLTIHYFLINLSIRPPFSEIFQNMKGIKQILDEIKKRSWYVSLTTGVFDIDMTSDFYRNNRENVDFAAKILLDHTFTSLYSIKPTYILSSIPSYNVCDVNFDHFNPIIKHYQKIGGIRKDVPFFDSILENDCFGVIVQLLRVLCEFGFYSSEQNEKKMKTLRDVIWVLKILSLYHKAIFAFTRFYDPYPGQLTKGNNIISFFKSLIELCNECHFYFELLPFDIYANLLMFLFPDTESYQSFLYSVVKEDQTRSNKNVCLDNNIPYQHLINLLQENSIVHHALALISTISKKKACILSKISAIKCLLLATRVEKVMQIICIFKTQILEKIHSTISGMLLWKHQEKDLLIFIGYAFKLIEIINIDIKIYDSCTSNDIGENTCIDTFCVISLISQRYPNEFIVQETEQMDKNISKITKGKKINQKSIRSFLENICRMMIKSLSWDTHIFPEILKRRNQISAKYSVTHTSQSLFAKIKHGKNKQNWRELLYKSFHDIKTYNNSETKDCFFAVKILDDNNIIATNSCGLHCVTGNGSTYSHTCSKIYYIDSSPDGRLLIGGGIMDDIETRFVDVWRYDQTDCLKEIKPSRNWRNLSWAKISNDNKNIYGMNNKVTANIYDIEKSNLIRGFYNATAQSFSKINSIEIDGSGNLILFNGYLFCIRSGKLINNFARFSPHISGIFMPSSFEVLINTELWDLRTFNLRDSFLHFKDVVVKRTFNDNILFGESVREDHIICYSGHQDFNWEIFVPLLGDYVALYNSKDLSQIVKKNFAHNLLFANISNDCNKLAIGFNDHDENNDPSHTFRLMGI